MIAYPELLIEPAKAAGIKIPDFLGDKIEFDHDAYPHLFVYLQMQLGRALPTPTAHWDNAKIVAEIPEDKIRAVTPNDLFNLGFC